MKNKIEELENEIEELKDDNIVLEDKNEELEDEIEKFKYKVEELEDEIEELKETNQNTLYDIMKNDFLNDISKKFSLKELQEIFKFKPGKGIQLK